MAIAEEAENPPPRHLHHRPPPHVVDWLTSGVFKAAEAALADDLHVQVIPVTETIAVYLPSRAAGRECARLGKDEAAMTWHRCRGFGASGVGKFNTLLGQKRGRKIASEQQYVERGNFCCQGFGCFGNRRLVPPPMGLVQQELPHVWLVLVSEVSACAGRRI